MDKHIQIELMYAFKDNFIHFEYFKNVKELKVFLGLHHEKFDLNYPNFCIKITSDKFDNEKKHRYFFTRYFYFNSRYFQSVFYNTAENQKAYFDEKIQEKREQIKSINQEINDLEKERYYFFKKAVERENANYEKNK
jgi:hypothetical protein